MTSIVDDRHGPWNAIAHEEDFSSGIAHGVNGVGRESMNENDVGEKIAWESGSGSAMGFVEQIDAVREVGCQFQVTTRPSPYSMCCKRKL